MEKTVQKIPFLRLTIAMALGVIVASQIIIPIWLIISFIVIFLSSLLVLNKNYQYRWTTLFGIEVHVMFFFIGTLSFNLYNKKPNFYENGKFLATVAETPQKKENSYKSVLIINAFSSLQNNEFIPTKEKVLVYFEPNNTVTKLSSGDKIVFIQNPQKIQNNGNPFEFDYKKYLRRRKIYRQVYLPSDEWTSTSLKPSFSIPVFAEKIRNKLLGIYKEQNLGENEFEILSALTLGYKRELDPEIKRVFSSAGAMHVLAVSGLHVGIIYGFLFFVLGFIRRKRAGQFLFATIVLFCLWAYAFITGLSPSVMRAATMLSFIVIGNSIKRQSNIYNSLAASALLLLLVNPNNLFEVGFQLSYSAVFGIVYLQPKLSKLFNTKNRVLNYFWILLTVSVAAQIATFPISVFYFNQFPTYFFLSNLFVIPAAIALIPLGILLLIFSSIPVIPDILSALISFILKIVYHLLKAIESFPFAVQKISITSTELIFIVTILVSFFLFLKTPRPKYFRLALFSIFLLGCTSFIQKARLKNTNKFIVYNSSENLIIQLISGKSNYVISKLEINKNDYEKTFIDNTTVKMNLNSPFFLNTQDSFKNKDIFLKNGVIYFKGKIILTSKISSKLGAKIHPDFIINPTYSINNRTISNKSAIIITNKRFLATNHTHSDQVFNILNQGAYQKKW